MKTDGYRIRSDSYAVYELVKKLGSSITIPITQFDMSTQESFVIEAILQCIPIPAIWVQEDAKGWRHPVKGEHVINALYKFIVQGEHLNCTRDTDLHGKTYDNLKNTLKLRLDATVITIHLMSEVNTYDANAIMNIVDAIA